MGADVLIDPHILAHAISPDHTILKPHQKRPPLRQVFQLPEQILRHFLSPRATFSWPPPSFLYPGAVRNPTSLVLKESKKIPPRNRGRLRFHPPARESRGTLTRSPIG